MARRHYINDSSVVQITSAIGTSNTSITVTSASSFPASFPFTAVLDAGLATAEVVLVTAAIAATLTVTRGYDGTAAQAHASNATFSHVAVQADFDEANSHINATSGVHGAAGSVVGTTDTQTLTNKTVTSPTLTGTVANTATHSGNPALVGKSTVATTGKSLSLQNSAGVEKVSVSDAGNTIIAGTLAVTGATTTGDATAPSFTATGDGKVTGVVVPKSYTNEAAATAALVTPPAGTVIWLTAATTGPVGLYTWDATAAAWEPIQTTQDVGFLGDSLNTAGTVTFSTTSDFAGLATVTVTLARQTRVKVTTIANFNPATAVSGRYRIQPGFNTGASAVIGSVTKGGSAYGVPNGDATTTGSRGGTNIATFLVAAGQVTFYAAVARVVGGAATDTANQFYTLVEALGNV